MTKGTFPLTIIPIFLSLSRVGSFGLTNFHANRHIWGESFQLQTLFKNLALGCDIFYFEKSRVVINFHAGRSLIFVIGI